METMRPTDEPHHSQPITALPLPARPIRSRLAHGGEANRLVLPEPGGGGTVTYHPPMLERGEACVGAEDSPNTI